MSRFSEYAHIVGRIKEKTNELLKQQIMNFVSSALQKLIELTPSVAMHNEWLLDKLAERAEMGLLENPEAPTVNDILNILEAHHDELDIAEAFKTLSKAETPVQVAVSGILGVAAQLANKIKPEWIQQLSYETVLEKAEKYNLSILPFLRKYPNVARRLIEWMKEELQERQQSQNSSMQR